MSKGKKYKYDTDFIARRTQEALHFLKPCKVCPRNCKTDRLNDEKRGICKLGRSAVVSSFNPHFGEESPLVGTGGSGTVFLTSCSLRCIFCQNYEISHLMLGTEVSAEEFALMMVDLQNHGCHNINLVTPTYFVPQILEALMIANTKGLNIPIVYNTGGYDSVEMLRVLDGIIDIYMPDFKFANKEVALKLAKAKDYPEVAKAAIKEMHRQVGDLIINDEGIAQKGLLIRHLVLPEGLAGTEEILRFIAEEISTDTYVNIMDQYYPCFGAFDMPPLNRRITKQEFDEAIRLADEYSLKRLDKRTFRG